MSTINTPTVHSTNFRQAIFDAHTAVTQKLWTLQGQYIWADGILVGGYRGTMMHCLAYLHSGNEQAIHLANRILEYYDTTTPCHFAPCMILEILLDHESHLEPKVRDLLINYLKRNLSYMATDDLQCHGYNDNHPHKAAQALILGGEWFGQQHFIDLGLKRLHQATTLFERNDFPSEYNSPNYLPVSLKPLAELANHTQHHEAQQLAIALERFHWNDLAEHFDGRVGLSAGPFCRGYAGDYRGMINNTVLLLSGLFPERFAFNVIDELYHKQLDSDLIDPSEKLRLPFYQSHIIWYITPQYHVAPQTVERIFEDKTGQTITGQIESGVSTHNCELQGSPSLHVMGPRNSKLTTYFGNHYSLGTAQYSWLDGVQAHGMIATVHQQPQATPAAAANYYTRLFYNEQAPLKQDEVSTYCFKEQGEYRTVQHRNAALVFYNPHPLENNVQRIRTGIFRPLWLNQPKAIYIGNTCITDTNYISPKIQTICIDEGKSYVGITPLRLTDHGQSRHADLEICVHGNELAILISSFEGWEPQSFTYQQILHTHTGFAIEVHDAKDWPSFESFRQSLALAQVEDYEYALMRRTRYAHNGIELSASYTPAHSMFRFSTAVDQI